MKDTGVVFQIQKFCTNDGPGIRTAVFLKGCPLDCKWCHNPESKKREANISINFVRCVHCGLCANICPCHVMENGKHVFYAQNCTMCGKCVKACPAKALTFCGENMTVDEIMEKVMSDVGFYQTTGGGLTVSGGEVLAQADFAVELLKEAKAKGIHTCIETSGAGTYEKLSKLAEYTDLFLYDVKASDEDIHKKYIGVSNKLIQENLKQLNDDGNKIVLRCPIIPGVNDNNEHFDNIARLYNELENVEAIDILPYHDLGSGKAARYGLELDFEEFTVPESSKVNEWKEYIENKKTR